jgi:UDP-N-acetylglucosamine 2-epimerase
VQQAIRLLNEPEHYQSMARVCMPYGDGSAGVKLAQLLACQP